MYKKRTYIIVYRISIKTITEEINLKRGNKIKMAGKKKNEKKTKKKGDSGSNNDGSSGFATLEVKIKHLESVNRSLEIQLAHQSEKTASAMSECRNMHSKMIEESSMNEKNKSVALDLSRDMTRQYKAMEDQLLNRINDRENALQNIVDEYTEAQTCHKNQLQKKENEIQSRDNEINKFRRSIDTMNDSFTEMLQNLREKLTKMVDLDCVRQKRMTSTPAENDDEKFLSIYRKMEKFSNLAD